jgi:hypothetical protein
MPVYAIVFFLRHGPKHSLPFKAEVFSLSRKEKFPSYLDQLERAVPDKQRRMASGIWPDRQRNKAHLG